MKSQHTYHWELPQIIAQLSAANSKYSKIILAIIQGDSEISGLEKEAATLNNRYLNREIIDHNVFLRIDKRIEFLNNDKSVHSLNLADLSSLIRILIERVSGYIADILEDSTDGTITQYQFQQHLKTLQCLFSDSDGIPATKEEAAIKIIQFVNKYIIAEQQINN